MQNTLARFSAKSHLVAAHGPGSGAWEFNQQARHPWKQGARATLSAAPLAEIGERGADKQS